MLLPTKKKKKKERQRSIARWRFEACCCRWRVVEQDIRSRRGTSALLQTRTTKAVIARWRGTAQHILISSPLYAAPRPAPARAKENTAQQRRQRRHATPSRTRYVISVSAACLASPSHRASTESAAVRRRGALFLRCHASFSRGSSAAVPRRKRLPFRTRRAACRSGL